MRGLRLTHTHEIVLSPKLPVQGGGAQSRNSCSLHSLLLAVMKLLRSQPNCNEQGEEGGERSCQSLKPTAHTPQGKGTPLSPTPHPSVGHRFGCCGCRAPSGGTCVQLTAAHPCSPA